MEPKPVIGIIQAENEDEMDSWVRELQNVTNTIQGRSSSGPVGNMYFLI